MNARDVILDILRKAYQIEVDGYTFYSMTADRAEKPAVRELFEKLAHDETEHQAFLREVLRRYDEKGSEAFKLNLRTPDLTAFTAKIFTDQFRQQAGGAEFEVAALSIGMTLETRAIQHFAGAAAQATEARGEEVLRVPRRLGTQAPRRPAEPAQRCPRRLLGVLGVRPVLVCASRGAGRAVVLARPHIVLSRLVSESARLDIPCDGT